MPSEDTKLITGPPPTKLITGPAPPSSPLSDSVTSPTSVRPSSARVAIKAVAPLSPISPFASTASSADKWVYSFGDGQADGSASMRSLLGGKGANLAEMSRLALPVPPGFTLTTAVCRHFSAHSGSYPAGLDAAVSAALRQLERRTRRVFGSPDNPLLLSVRSGAAVSMPGMMDTVLNLGLNDSTVKALRDTRFAYDSYRRFLQMFGNVVLEIPLHHFESVLDAEKAKHGITHDTHLSAAHLQHVVQQYKQVIQTHSGKPFPTDPSDQLSMAIAAVFRSWGNDRARVYRRLNAIPDSLGTAVTVQAMVFGNQGDDCATGVAFTRDPATGENVFYGEYLINAQGEDVVAGIRTPQQISIAGKLAQGSDLPSMEETMPGLYKELVGVRHTLETHFRDVQDMEFTVQAGKLYLLQTRNAKRAAAAAVRIAVEMVEERLISKREAVKRVQPSAIPQLLHRSLSPAAKKAASPLTSGLPASPGAATGAAVFRADDVDDPAVRACVLVRAETSPDDVAGMARAAGVATARGGMTSHAAVVARGMGVPCVSGAGGIVLSADERSAEVGGVTINEGDIITIDGSTGAIYAGALDTQAPSIGAHFHTLLGWADECARLVVVANAETEADVTRARDFGARGVGLARTEHMFFHKDRITAVQAMILAKSEKERAKPLAKLTPMQTADFYTILKLMHGFPVTVRLLDPPLHEFLPSVPDDADECADLASVAALLGDPDTKDVTARTRRMAEANPMLGLRGCRVGILYPDVYAMQVRAALEAAVSVARDERKTHGTDAVPVQLHIMVPFVSAAAELRVVRAMIDDVAKEVLRNAHDVHGLVDYKVGTMIELPRAALRAADIAKEAEFFSFGTNDLTQTTFGLSRDDAGVFLPAFQKQHILDADPFVQLDTDGVGELIQMAVDRGTASRPQLHTCLCGEQGADPASVRFCHDAGLHSVSCSPYAVPVARLAAAHAAIDADKQ